MFGNRLGVRGSILNESRPGQFPSICLATILEAGLRVRNSCVAKR